MATCLSFRCSKTSIIEQTVGKACQVLKALQEAISVPMKSWFIFGDPVEDGEQPHLCCLPELSTMNFPSTTRNQSYSWLGRTDPMAGCTCGCSLSALVCVAESVNCSINSSQAHKDSWHLQQSAKVKELSLMRSWLRKGCVSPATSSNA